MRGIKINTNKKLYTVLAVYTLFILLGIKIVIFSYVALLLGVLLIISQPLDINIYTLVFIMNLASIFKTSADGQSFFTYIMIAFVLCFNMSKRISKVGMSILLLGVYLVCTQIIFGNYLHITRTIKLVISIEFIYCIWKNKPRIIVGKVFQLYVSGLIVSSIIALFGSELFNIKQYVMEKAFQYGNAYLNRFSGLYADPNYYGVNIIIAACLLIVLFHTSKIKITAFIMDMVALIYFAISTYSKSVFLMFIVPIGLFIYSQYKQRHRLVCLFSMVFAILLIIVVFSGNISGLDVIFSRLQGNNLNELTTGRFDLWIGYFNTITTELKYILFGRGISYPLLNGHAAHNTYIQLIYYLGIVGTVWLMLILFSMNKARRIKRNLLNYSVLFTIVIMYFFLSELFYFDAPFHVMLSILVLNYNMDMKNIIPKGESRWVNY